MERIRNLLILRGGALGDFLLTLPVVAAVHRQWPAVAIDLLIDSRFAELAIGSGWVRKVHSLEAALMAQLYVSDTERDPELAKGLRGYDAAICYLEDSERTIRRTLEEAGIRQYIFVSPRVTRGHATDHFMEALRGFGLETRSGEFAELHLPLGNVRAERVGCVAQHGPFVAIHPGSGNALKNWPVDRFIRLADQIQKTMAFHPVFLLGEAEDCLENVLEKAMPSALCLTKLKLMEVAAVLKQARFYIGNDSGISHLAAALGTPTWALFGPTDPAQWAPRGLQVHVVRNSKPGLYPMERLAEETVWQALRIAYREHAKLGPDLNRARTR
jgi:heptosyltransferase-2